MAIPIIDISHLFLPANEEKKDAQIAVAQAIGEACTGAALFCMFCVYTGISTY